MGLFDRFTTTQYCDICGRELGKLFGRTKLADGLICKDCAEKLSPHFTGARQSSVEQIKEQLAYREQNKQAVAAFHVTRTIGEAGTKVYLDEDSAKVIVSANRNWREANPDVLDYDQVTGCNVDVKESKTEIKRTDSEGNKVSYNPPRYDIDYDFYVTLFVNSPYFSEIRFKVNQNRIDKRTSAEYRQAEQTAEEIRNAFTSVRAGVRAAAAPKAAVQCPNCLATTYPDANGCCEYCGGPLGVQSRPATQSFLEQDLRPQADRAQSGWGQGFSARDAYGQDAHPGNSRERDVYEDGAYERDSWDQDSRGDYGQPQRAQRPSQQGRTSRNTTGGASRRQMDW